MTAQQQEFPMQKEPWTIAEAAKYLEIQETEVTGSSYLSVG